MESEHLAQSNCHIRISGKIKINLECISCCPQPCGCHRKTSRSHDRYGIPKNTDIICQQYFLTESDHKSVNTFCKICRILPSGLHLLCNRLILHNRSRNQLREHRHIGTILNPAYLDFRYPQIHIYGIGHGLERKKRNTYR